MAGVTPLADATPPPKTLTARTSSSVDGGTSRVGVAGALTTEGSISFARHAADAPEREKTD